MMTSPNEIQHDEQSQTLHQLRAATLRRLVLVSLLLTVVVIGLGAYTRLTHAGLGCPDWPTCYGLIDVPQTSEEIRIAEQAFPERAVEPQKAWNEMIHRYFAGSLGLLIAAIALLAIKYRVTHKESLKLPLWLPILTLAVVTFQAALGMWTVTMMLMPVVVMGHLLGGFTTLCLLFFLYLKLRRHANSSSEHEVATSQVTDNTEQQASNNRTTTERFKRYATFGIIILATQIALGGWTSANYAALSCVELPVCQGDWQNQLHFSKAFSLLPPPKDSYEFGHLPHNERLTIHVTHRLGAVITTLYLAWLALILFKQQPTPRIKKATMLVVVLLAIQVGLGVSNIWYQIPLNIAVAHNLVAALLMLSLISLTYQLSQKTRGLSHE